MLQTLITNEPLLCVIFFHYFTQKQTKSTQQDRPINTSQFIHASVYMIINGNEAMVLRLALDAHDHRKSDVRWRGGRTTIVP